MDELDLEQRVASLESEVQALKDQVLALSEARPLVTGVPAANVHPRPQAVRPAPAVRPPAAPKEPISLSDVVAKLGIVLFLLGIAFLLKLTIDYGWLTESVRVVLGGAAGLGLVGTGLFMGEQRRALGAVLMGGGAAALYATGFAAHVMYEFIALTPAFIVMGAVTLTAVVLAVRQNFQSLAVIAAIGGMLTPFVLQFDQVNVGFMAVHTAIVLAGFCVVYGVKNWWGVYAVTTIPGWLTIAGAIASQSWTNAVNDRFWVVTALAIALGALVLTVALRKKPNSFDRFLLIAFTTSTVPMLIYLTSTWVAAGVSVAMALGLGILAALPGHRRNTFIIAGVAVAFTGIAPLSGVNEYMAMLVAMTIAYNAITRWESGESGVLSGVGFATLGGVGLWCLVTLGNSVKEPMFFNTDGLHLILGTATLLALGALHRNETLRWAHFYGGAAAFLALMTHQLQDLSLGSVITTIIWGALGLTFLLSGIFRNKGHMQAAGLFGIAMTAAKLLIFDLESVATIWRVILFMGFGGVLLLISFFLTKRGEKEAKSTT